MAPITRRKTSPAETYPPPLNAPAMLAAIRASGVRVTDVVLASGLSKQHGIRVIYSMLPGGYYAAARLRIACRNLGIALPDDGDTVKGAASDD